MYGLNLILCPSPLICIEKDFRALQSFMLYLLYVIWHLPLTKARISLLENWKENFAKTLLSLVCIGGFAYIHICY